MKKKVNFLDIFIKFCTSLFIVMPILNMLITVPFLGIIGLINKLDIFEIKSLIFVLLCIIIVGIITLIFSTLTFVLFKKKKYKLNINIIICSMLFGITFFILSYASYGSTFLTDLLNGIDLTDSIFKMVVYLLLGFMNVFVAIDYFILLISDEIIKFINI